MRKGTDRKRARTYGWAWVGDRRPPFAETPREGQESVWDYPRPPRVEPDARAVVVRSGSVVIAESQRAVRILETASPPTFYIPPEDVRADLLVPAEGGSVCEWKGIAVYRDLVLPDRRIARAAWVYHDPRGGFERIRDHVAFYPSLLECYVGAERVRPQPGRFYGGWVTSELAGPFKGEPGSDGW